MMTEQVVGIKEVLLAKMEQQFTTSRENDNLQFAIYHYVLCSPCKPSGNSFYVQFAKQCLLQVWSAHGGIDLSSPHATAAQVEAAYKISKNEACM